MIMKIDGIRSDYLCVWTGSRKPVKLAVWLLKVCKSSNQDELDGLNLQPARIKQCIALQTGLANNTRKGNSERMDELQ